MLLCFSVLGFAVISWVLWKFVLSSPPSTTTQQSSLASSSSTAASRGGSRSTSSVATTTSSTTTTTTASKHNTDDNAYTFGKSRHPPHFLVPPNNTKQQDLSGYLLQGIVPFRSTYASGYETRLQQQQQQQQQSSMNDNTTTKENDIIVTNRKERARIFARMFSPTLTKQQKAATTKPPNRGANIVITIHHTDVHCNKLHKVLYLLGTYYNLFLLIDGSEYVELNKINNDEKVLREYIDRLRFELLNNGNDDGRSSSSSSTTEGGGEEEEYKLNEQIIPKHRIIFTSTSKGRVAFVRQLHGTELVVDYDKGNVTKELERFGFRVLVYPREEEKKEDGDGEKIISQTSALGKFLIP